MHWPYTGICLQHVTIEYIFLVSRDIYDPSTWGHKIVLYNDQYGLHEANVIRIDNCQKGSDLLYWDIYKGYVGATKDLLLLSPLTDDNDQLNLWLQWD